MGSDEGASVGSERSAFILAAALLLIPRMQDRVFELRPK